jgi:carboxyl-terminal processing protease
MPQIVSARPRGRGSVGRQLASAALAAVFLALASCAMGDATLIAAANGHGGAVAVDSNDQRLLGRVIDRSYRAIADRYIDPPDFRHMTTQALRAVALIDGGLDVEESDRKLRIARRGQTIVEVSAPATASDGRAWASVFSETVDAMVAASPALAGAERDRMIKASMEAITRQLDRNSRYSDPEEARDNRFMRDGAGGIGITLQIDGEDAVIGSIQEGSPADRGGMRVGDRLVGVNGKPVNGAVLREIVRDVRGPIGESVNLTLRRPDEKRNIDVKIVRDRVIPTTVTTQRRGDLLHVQLTGFNSATTDMLRKALRRARDDGGRPLAGIILDMRNNPGGLLDQAVSVAELFLESGVIATTNGRHPDSKQTFRSTASADFAGVPMVAVMNGRSASAAEILGAALQERGRAVLVGSMSYGKGSVQTVVRLPNGGELTLTWSKLYGPSGHTWNEVGVLPELCASKYADANGSLDRQVDAGVKTWRDAIARFHKVSRPTAMQIQEMRGLCPPVTDSSDKDLRLAERVLRDQPLYGRLVRAGTESVAQSR